MLAGAALMLISPRLLGNTALWASMAALIFFRIASDWPLADNHIYLLGYWALANAVALRDSDPARALAQMSRWLLGLAFLLAVVWKAVLSPDFLDGRFFRVTFLTDPRLVEPAMLLGGLTIDQVEQGRRVLVALPEGAALAEPVPEPDLGRLPQVARLATWGSLVHEAAIAAAMLLPSRSRVVIARHVLLLAFCAVTYALAPVAGFGWLLLVMGLAQAGAAEVWLRRAYVAAFLLVLFYAEVPWPELLLNALP
jgi:hypothetical protein